MYSSVQFKYFFLLLPIALLLTKLRAVVTYVLLQNVSRAGTVRVLIVPYGKSVGMKMKIFVSIYRISIHES